MNAGENEHQAYHDFLDSIGQDVPRVEMIVMPEHPLIGAVVECPVEYAPCSVGDLLDGEIEDVPVKLQVIAIHANSVVMRVESVG